MILNRIESGITNRQYVRFGYDRREAFVRHFLIHGNATRAYREAGYKDGPGTRQSAHRLLTSADIQARIAEERQELLAMLDEVPLVS